MHLNLSVLQNCQAHNIYYDPFPHIIIKDALPQNIAKVLTSNFLISESNQSLNNHRIDIAAGDIDHQDYLIEEWKNFITFHTSKEFLHEVLNIFGPTILKNIPDYFSSLNQLYNLNVGTRKIDSFEEFDILLDTQISINSPVTQKTSVRLAHTDNTNKLFSGLLYLRQPEDDSVGGNLNICNWNSNYNYKQKLKYYREGLHPKHFSVYKEIEYENNVFILFLNSIDALHAVTPREITPHNRTFVNFVAELPYDIFYRNTFLKRQFIQFFQFLRDKKSLLKRVSK